MSEPARARKGRRLMFLARIESYEFDPDGAQSPKCDTCGMPGCKQLIITRDDLREELSVCTCDACVQSPGAARRTSRRIVDYMNTRAN